MKEPIAQGPVDVNVRGADEPTYLMTTSAGIYFKADKDTVEKMKAAIPSLDAITNEGGLGVSCTPDIGKCDGGYYLSGQTHWSYDGTNGRALLEEIKKWIEVNGFKVKIFDEYDA